MDLPNGHRSPFAALCPSQDMLERLIRHLDKPLTGDLLQGLPTGAFATGRHIRLEGKELRGTVPAGKKYVLVQMVNVSSLAWGAGIIILSEGLK